MSQLSVISLSEAKEFLKVDFDSEDALITSLIKSAVDFVEKRTNYILWERDEFKFLRQYDKIYDYPFALASSETASEYEIIENRLYSSIRILSGITYPNKGRSVELTIGYNDPSLIPNPLIDACKRLITYWYDQREMEMAKIPNDVYILIQPYIRDFTI